MEAGIDSLAATELSSRLATMSGLKLSPTLLFEQPTPRAIATHMLEQLGECQVAAPSGLCAMRPPTGSRGRAWLLGSLVR